jgi:diguanylate cyclase (GGDEF)-like protein
LTGQRARKLIEANEQLVMTALRAQADAEAATDKLEVLSRSSELDSLTDLPNRQSLLSRFTYAISIARRTGTQLALLFIDLNNFKQINDTLGHAVGDQVLRLAAKRLATAVRQSDTVSRHGGDEFLILLTDVSDPNDVVQIAINLIAALGRPARVGEHALRLTASIGISLFPHDGEDTETLIQRADAAMYRAKRNGQGAFSFYGSGTSVDADHTATPVPSALHHPLSHYRAALAEQARRHAQLRDANEQLVLTSLSAQNLQEAAERKVAHMSRLVGDLLDNASKYSKEGADIGLSVTQAEDRIVITVSGTGIRMSALTIVRELVAAHGGTIIARSAGGGSGNSFVVTLPRTGPASTSTN